MKIGSIVIQCFEFEKMMKFWQEALYYIPREPSVNGWVVLKSISEDGPNISLKRVAEKRSGKRNRLHIDLYTPKQNEEVARLVTIGARRYPWQYMADDDFIVLEDPDGNLFCVVQKP